MIDEIINLKINHTKCGGDFKVKIWVKYGWKGILVNKDFNLLLFDCHNVEWHGAQMHYV
jgi:hypothetical protein